jgi:hypothetical protein
VVKLLSSFIAVVMACYVALLASFSWSSENCCITRATSTCRWVMPMRTGALHEPCTQVRRLRIRILLRVRVPVRRVPGTADLPAPTESGLYRRGRAYIRELNARGVDRSHVILFGHSLGTRVAVQMTEEFHVAGLMLLAPASSRGSCFAVGVYHDSGTFPQRFRFGMGPPFHLGRS